MRYFNYFILFFLIFCSLISCRRENMWFPDTIIKGVVTDKNTGVPLENCTVSLVRSHPGDMWGIFGTVTVEKRKTDSKGNYQIKFRADENFIYSLALNNSDYYTEWYKINKGDNITINVELIAESSLTLKVKNISPFDDNDHISLTIDSKGYFGFSHFSYGFTGTNINIEMIKEVNGYYPIKFDWTVRKNGIYTSFNDSLVCLPNKYNEFIINY